MLTWTAVLPFVAAVSARQSAFSELVVHEWGTFTSVQGSDGSTLEGLHHEEEALPPFVHQMDRAAGIELNLARRKGLARRVAGVTVKMETPVTYFYSPRSLSVRARVELKHGLLSQWFPAAEAGEESRAESGRLDFREVERGWLDWQIDMLAPGLGEGDAPGVENDSPWLAARIPQANRVRAHVAATEERPAHDETEGFLFYRGLARFDLPIVATASEGARLRIVNTSELGDVLTHLFVLHVRDGHGDFQYVSELAPGAAVEVVQPVSSASPTIEEMVARLAPALERSLASSGLLEPEAHAMVETWKRSYFHTEGLRVLYVLPQRFTDAILPLDVSPAPREVVRVLVGRLECLTPEIEGDVARAVAEFESEDEAVRHAAWSRIERHARFLEPLLRRVDALASDSATHDRIAGWLAQFGA